MIIKSPESDVYRIISYSEVLYDILKPKSSLPGLGITKPP